MLGMSIFSLELTVDYKFELCVHGEHVYSTYMYVNNYSPNM